MHSRSPTVPLSATKALPPQRPSLISDVLLIPVQTFSAVSDPGIKTMVVAYVAWRQSTLFFSHLHP